jgi:hypothetical protein
MSGRGSSGRTLLTLHTRMRICRVEISFVSKTFFFEKGAGLHIRKLFEKYDADQDGLLNPAEFGMFCASVESDVKADADAEMTLVRAIIILR